MLTFEEYKKRRDELAEDMKIIGESLRVFPRNSMGLVSDEIRTSKEYSVPKHRFACAFKQLQELNKKYIKIYKKELQAERKQRYITPRAN